MKIFTLLILCLLLIGSVSAYYCVYEEDNETVKNFKSKLNTLAIEHDLREGISKEAIVTKVKYFNPCR